MNRTFLRNRTWLALLIVGLTATIFLIDVLTPVGVLISMLFAIPIYLTRFLPGLWMVPAFTTVCTVLNLLQFFLAPPGG